MSAKEQFEREMISQAGNTKFSPGVARFLVISFLLVLLIVPVFQQFHESSSDTESVVGKIFQVFVADGPSEESDGNQFFSKAHAFNDVILQNIDDVESHLDNNIWLTEKLLPGAQALMTDFLKTGSEKAYIGKDNWVFYRDDVSYLTNAGFAIDEPLRAVLEFDKQLKKRGLALILVPVPVKPIIYPEQLSKFGDFDEINNLKNESYHSFIERVKGAGVDVLDPTEALLLSKKQTEESLYLKGDTHWSPAGVKLVADLLAKHVKSKLSPEDMIGEGDVSETTQTINNVGDTVRMLKLPESDETDFIEEVRISQVDSDKLKDGPLLYLGDSFSNIFSLASMGWGSDSGIVEQLEKELGFRIDAILQNDDGAFATRKQLSMDLHQGKDRFAGKKLVIWQFSMRELMFGSWKLGYKYPEVEGSTVLSRASIEVRAELIKTTKAPDPDKSDYADALIFAKFKVLSVLSGKTDESELLVTLRAMDSFKLTDASQYKVGQKVRLKLIPFDDCSKKIKTFTRLDDIEDYTSPLFFAVESGLIK